MSAVVVDTYGSLDAVRRLNGPWDAIARRARLGPSSRFDWFDTLWEVHWEREDLIVLVARDGGTVLGIAPLRIERDRLRRVPCRSIGLLNGLYAVHGTPLVAAERLPEVADALVRELLRSGGSWDIWRMGFDRGHSQTAVFESQLELAGVPYTLSSGQRSPYLTLEGTWEAHLKRLPSKFRSDLKTRERRLREKGRLEMSIVDGMSGCDEALGAIFEIEEASWKSGARSSMTRTVHQQAFYTRYAARAAAAGMLRLVLLHLDGEPIAYDYAVLEDGVYYLLKTSFKEKYRSDSAGVVLRKLVIEWLHAQGASEIDFLGKDEDWKLKWTSSVREHVHVTAFSRHWRGRLLHRLDQTACAMRAYEAAGGNIAPSSAGAGS